eukprot:84056_1
MSVCRLNTELAKQELVETFKKIFSYKYGRRREIIKKLDINIPDRDFGGVHLRHMDIKRDKLLILWIINYVTTNDALVGCTHNPKHQMIFFCNKAIAHFIYENVLNGVDYNYKLHYNVSGRFEDVALFYKSSDLLHAKKWNPNATAFLHLNVNSILPYINLFQE